MAKGIQIASTTDGQADIERAIGLEPSAEALKEERERMEAQAAPPPEQAPPPEPEPQKPPQKTKAEKRIDKLVFEREEARREAEALKARVAELETSQRNAMPPGSQNGHSQPPTQEHLARVQEARGKYADWDDVMAQAQNKAMAGDVLEAVERLDNSADVVYFLARSDEYREQLNKLPPQVQREQILRISTDLIRSQGIVEDIAAFLAKKPDVKELNERAPRLRDEIAGVVRQATMEVPNPGELTYHLLSHPDVVRKLNEMTPRQAFIEVIGESGRLEKTATPKPISSAPAPIAPLGGYSTKSSVPLDQMEYREFRRVRDQQEKEWRGGVRR
jgi:hypothetical protein